MPGRRGPSGADKEMMMDTQWKDEELPVSEPAEAISWQDRRAAGPMHLRSLAKSDEAQQLVERLIEEATLRHRPTLRPSSLGKHRKALGAIFGDLLKLEAEGRCGGHGVAPRDFPAGLGFGRDIFLQVKEDLVRAGLLAYEPGWQRLHNWTNFNTGAPTVSSGGGMVSRFQLSAKALDLTQAAGVSLDAWEDHWEREKAARAPVPKNAALIVLRARKGPRVAGARERGVDLPVDFSQSSVAAMTEDLRAHNTFLLDRGVEGVEFLGLRRLFTDGDQPDFNWQRHGRFYSMPGAEAYENLKGKGVERRRRLRLGGQRVGEVDIRASHLTLLYALRGLPFTVSGDPYAVTGLDRELVKRWIAQALGRDNIRARTWSGDARQYFASVRPGEKLKDAVPFRSFGEKVLTHHPILRDLGQPGVPTSAELTFHESEVLRRAMATLRLQGIPSLPVHDSLLVPVGELQRAAVVIVDAFLGHVESVVGVSPNVVPSVQLKLSEDVKD